MVSRAGRRQELGILQPSAASLVWVVAAMALLAAAGGVTIAGLRISAVAWIVSLVIGSLFVALKFRRVRFPWPVWLPWLTCLALATDFSRFEALVRFVILLTPLCVAMGTSTAWFASSQTVRRALRWLFFASVGLYVVAVLASGNLSIADGYWYLVEGSCMTFVLLGAAAAIKRNSSTRPQYMVLFVCLAVLFLSQSRWAFLVLALLVLIGPTGQSWRWRVMVAAMYLLAASLLFHSTGFQDVMFRTAVPSLADLGSLETREIRTGGRLVAWPAFLAGIDDFWFGEGSVASSDYGQLIFGEGRWSHPHNEYIRLLFDYGAVGLFLFLMPLIWLTWDLTKRLRREREQGSAWLTRFAIAGLIGFGLLAVSGNVLMYHAWYGNLLFAAIGVCYATTSRADKAESSV